MISSVALLNIQRVHIDYIRMLLQALDDGLNPNMRYMSEEKCIVWRHLVCRRELAGVKAPFVGEHHTQCEPDLRFLRTITYFTITMLLQYARLKIQYFLLVFL